MLATVNELDSKISQEEQTSTDNQGGSQVSPQAMSEDTPSPLTAVPFQKKKVTALRKRLTQS
jgi:hypothetical protein